MAKQTPATVQKIVDQAAATVLNARSQAADKSAGSAERVKDLGTTLLDAAKVGILGASALCAGVGLALLSWLLPKASPADD